MNANALICLLNIHAGNEVDQDENEQSLVRLFKDQLIYFHNGRYVTSKKGSRIVRILEQVPTVWGGAADALTPADYEQVISDHQRLVRELDQLINGPGGASSPSLCDIVGQLKHRNKG